MASFVFQDKHWLLRQPVNPMSESSLTFLDDAYRRRYNYNISFLYQTKR